ncbi:hypothetical protein AVEN_170173-1 [Araneus ventricosus]|uniref:Uncharacterized protein n=1 Tax=Araneus ventricosus TaxID=182803 RepID=A0A4Y2L1H4_ARAVE|nr:hypothetical protein AVEN_170173-1 [Araneus ventricosus]
MHFGSSVESGFEPGTFRTQGQDLTTRPPRLPGYNESSVLRSVSNSLNRTPMKLMYFQMIVTNFQSKEFGYSEPKFHLFLSVSRIDVLLQCAPSFPPIGLTSHI